MSELDGILLFLLLAACCGGHWFGIVARRRDHKETSHGR
jgi:hypothetical protein